MYTKQMLQELREFTGEGLLACRKALEECEGNVLHAAGWLATEGQLAYRPNDTPAKRMGRAICHAKTCYVLYNGKLERIV